MEILDILYALKEGGVSFAPDALRFLPDSPFMEKLGGLVSQHLSFDGRVLEQSDLNLILRYGTQEQLLMGYKCPFPPELARQVDVIRNCPNSYNSFEDLTFIKVLTFSQITDFQKGKKPFLSDGSLPYVCLGQSAISTWVFGLICHIVNNVLGNNIELLVEYLFSENPSDSYNQYDVLKWHGLSPPIVRPIYSLCRGNPLMLEELGLESFKRDLGTRWGPFVKKAILSEKIRYMIKMAALNRDVKIINRYHNKLFPSTYSSRFSLFIDKTIRKNFLLREDWEFHGNDF